MLQSELEAIQRQLKPDEDITDLPAFNITVAYVPKDGFNVVTHILEGVEFTEDPREIKQGDKFQEIVTPIMFLGRKSIV